MNSSQGSTDSQPPSIELLLATKNKNRDRNWVAHMAAIAYNTYYPLNSTSPVELRSTENLLVDIALPWYSYSKCVKLTHAPTA